MNTAMPTPRAELPVLGDEDLKALVFDDYPSVDLANRFAQRIGQSPNNTVPCKTIITMVDTRNRTVGAILAEGAVQGRLHLTPDGCYAELLVSWPQTQTWSHARCEYLKHQARLLCIANYEKIISTHVEQLQAIEPSASVLMTFIGEWDETSEPLRKRLASRVMKAFMTQHSPQQALAA